MYSTIRKLFITVILSVFMVLPAIAQTCSGSLGDPVINETFGNGSTIVGPALAPGTTTTAYTSDCPYNGHYSIVKNINTAISCYGGWQSVATDHTGDNGYMMLIDASETPDVFYIQQAHGLCPGTTYEFAAYIMNLVKLSAAGASPIQPNITFSIETVSGTVLATYNTQNIPPSATPTWIQYGTFFTTPTNVSDVVVKMINNAPGGNGNDLVLDDITFKPCGPVLHAGIGTATGASTQPICAGSNANFTLQASYSTGLNSPAFQWQANTNGAGWADIAGQTSKSLNVAFVNAATGSYQYRFGAFESYNMSSPVCRVYSNPVEVDVNPTPVITVTAQQSVCEGGSVQLLASGGAGYQWSGPNLPPTSQNPLIINNISLAQAGTYTVVATSPQNCSATATSNVVVYPKVTAMVSANATICQGQSTGLSAGGGTIYSWLPATGLSNPNIANPVANPTDTTTYTVNVSNANGCFDTKTVTVNVLKSPVANAGGKKIIFEGQSVKLNGSAKGNISSVYWTPATYLDNPNTLNPVATPLKDITYTLHVQSANNCGSDTSSLFVRVYNKLVIPNTFSPNKDGVNDYWAIDALVTYPGCLLTIFNRYGQVVYKSTGYSTPWNGVYKGALLPVGTYYYVIDLKNNTPQLGGWVAIVR